MIGILDSGIGGVTVLNEILKNIEPHHYIYYSDSLNNPYGDKSKEDLYMILTNIVDFFKRKGCQIIVLACNTASTLCVDFLRASYPDITFIAIEPAYKMVHDNHPIGDTLVMATKGTLESEKFKCLYNQYKLPNTILYSCSGLAELIEQNNKEKIKSYIQNNLISFKGVENVVLGCTHYPLIKEELSTALGNIFFFDGGQGVAMELKRCLNKKKIPCEKENTIEFIDSSHSQVKKERFFDLLKEELSVNV